MNVTAAFPVTEGSQVGEPRRTVLWHAARLGFSEARAARAALVTTELATNLLKHARSGEILLQTLTREDGTPEGIEILALDKGPGIPDFALARRDGHSTTGTLGHGLGAIERQCDSFELYTDARGTAIAARLWRDPAARRPPAGRYEVGAAHVSKPGESVCGDAWTWRMRDERLAILVADGLGHGISAHEAASTAVAAFARGHEESPGRMVEDVHAALRSTRGAAVAAVAVDLHRGVAVYAGLGNIAGAILLPGGARHNMVSHNGTAGHAAGRIQEFAYPVPSGALLVLASDGLTTHWDIKAYPGLRSRSPSLIAGVLYRDFSRRRDDVTVVVATERPPRAEKL